MQHYAEEVSSAAQHPHLEEAYKQMMSMPAEDRDAALSQMGDKELVAAIRTKMQSAKPLVIA